MQELEKILREIEAEFDRRIDIQLKIMAGLGDDVYRYGYGKSLEAYQQGKLFVEDIIRKHMNDGWIPVEERLPEEAGTYIVNALNGERSIVTFAKWKNRYKRFDMTGARAYWRIIAWRPLPEPYRLERSDNNDGE